MRTATPPSAHPFTRRGWLAALLAGVPTVAAVVAPAFAAAATPAAAAPADDAWAALSDGAIALMRHADAPGIGDPPGFRLGDCATQRNLGDAGRAQARRIGEAFARRGVKVGAVLSSRWCRARDTAELAFPGRVRVEPAFDSFFDERRAEPERTAAARAILERWRGPGVLVVATHQVNISALTGEGAASGEIVIVRPEAGALKVLGRLRP